MVLNLTGDAKFPTCRFWILDFGFWIEERGDLRRIHNLKSEIQNRTHGCVGSAGISPDFLCSTCLKKIVVRGSWFVVLRHPDIQRELRTMNNELPTTNNDRRSINRCHSHLPACRIFIEQHLYVINFLQIFPRQYLGRRSLGKNLASL